MILGPVRYFVADLKIGVRNQQRPDEPETDALKQSDQVKVKSLDSRLAAPWWTAASNSSVELKFRIEFLNKLSFLSLSLWNFNLFNRSNMYVRAIEATEAQFNREDELSAK